MSSFWTKMRERMTGEPRGGISPENEIIRGVIADFEKAALSKGKDFGQQVLVQSTKAGLPPEAFPYVFWVLVEGASTWPVSGSDRTNLGLARDLLVRSDNVPSYTRGFQIPTGGMENQVDAVIRNMAAWAKALMATLRKELRQMVNREKAGLAEVLRRHEGLEGKAVVYAYRALEGAAESQPSWFRNPDLMQPLLAVVLGVA